MGTLLAAFAMAFYCPLLAYVKNRLLPRRARKAPNGETRTQHWVAVFYGEAVSGTLSSESPEILEVKTFEELPANFAGDLGKFYEDLR